MVDPSASILLYLESLRRGDLEADTNRVTREIADLKASKDLEEAEKALVAALGAGDDDNGLIEQEPTQRSTFASLRSYRRTPDLSELSTVDQTVGVEFWMRYVIY